MAAHAILTASPSTLHSLLSPLPANHSSFHGVSFSLPRQSFSFSLAVRTATKKKAAVAVLNGTSNGPTTVHVRAAGLTPGDEFGDVTNGCTSTGVTEATIVDNQIPFSGPDTLIGSGFEVDELEDDLGMVLTMATAIGSAARRVVFRRFSTGGKVLSEEEKAAENVYIKVIVISGQDGLLKLRVLELLGFKFWKGFCRGMVYHRKKVEQEKLEKLARKGPKPEETAAAGSGGATSTAASSTPPGASAEKVSTDKYRNYAVVAGAITALGALGWYLKSGGKKQEEVRD
ncbi:unnamed protein product [Dovyalis caffra]|uniref:Uncharacterized protein n=1 Tax=Dovyalis caffra TaxID=77055 RepID=A0AAV1R9F4_9ROSI|nr:unnamed protein product [Dovyalis caffra]